MMFDHMDEIVCAKERERIAELEAENKELRETLDWIEAEPEDPHKVQQRARQALSKLNSNKADTDEAKRKEAQEWLEKQPGVFKIEPK